MGEAGDDGVAVADKTGGEAADFGVSGVAGAVDPGVEVLPGALVADQGGEPAGEVGDGVEVRAAAAGVGEIGVVVVGEFVAGGGMIQAVIRRADGTQTAVAGAGRVRLMVSQSRSTRKLPW